MQLFFHDVGLKGANADFPKTIYADLAISDIVEYVPDEFKPVVQDQLMQEFPDGWCNVWGVPQGASSVIKQLTYDDVMLLIKTTGGDGDIPALCHIKGFWKEPMLELSKFLWGSAHFPYVFFFKTIDIDLTWTQFKQDVSYLPKFRPSGNVYRVKQERLENHGGVEEYVKKLIASKSYVSSSTNSFQLEEPNMGNEYAEGVRNVKEVSYFKRNSKLVSDAKAHYGYVCQACGFDFYDVYGQLGENYIECHHKNPLSERDIDFVSTIEDVCVVCSNCHRMLHRKSPAMSLDDLRNVLCMKNV